MTWNSGSVSPPLVTGLIYQVRYSATNIQGEGPKSDIVRILLAVASSPPNNIQRIDLTSLTAGDVRITWSIPVDNGGTPVVGYKIYLNQALLVDASD